MLMVCSTLGSWERNCFCQPWKLGGAEVSSPLIVGGGDIVDNVDVDDGLERWF